MRIGILILAILCFSHGSAQDRFFTFVEGWRNNVGIEYEQNYHVLGLERVGQPGQNGLVLNNLSDDGSIVGDISFSIDTLNSIDIWDISSTSIWIDDSNLLIPGRTSTGTSNSGALFRYDAEEQVIELLSTHDFAVFTVFFWYRRIL